MLDTGNAVPRLRLDLIGTHEYEIRDDITGMALLSLPSTVITVDRPFVALAWLEGWFEARMLGNLVFADAPAPKIPVDPPTSIRTWITFDRDSKFAIEVNGRTGEASPNGIGVVSVTAGNLTLAVRDMEALTCQVQAWSDLYDHMWNGSKFPRAATVAARVEHERTVRVARRGGRGATLSIRDRESD